MNNLTKGAVAFSVLSIMASGALMASAASETAVVASNGKAGIRGLHLGNKVKPVELTDVQKKEMDAKRAAVEAALKASDYNAWVAAEKAINENCPLLAQINASNFAKFAEAMNLHTQADLILKDLGLEGQGMMMGRGMGGFGPGRGHESGFGLKELQK